MECTATSSVAISFSWLQQPVTAILWLTDGAVHTEEKRAINTPRCSRIFLDVSRCDKRQVISTDSIGCYSGNDHLFGVIGYSILTSSKKKPHPSTDFLLIDFFSEEPVARGSMVSHIITLHPFLLLYTLSPWGIHETRNYQNKLIW